MLFRPWTNMNIALLLSGDKLGEENGGSCVKWPQDAFGCDHFGFLCWYVSERPFRNQIFWAFRASDSKIPTYIV